MFKTMVLATSIAMAWGAAQSLRPRVVTLDQLTVPAKRLPPGCGLSPAEPVRLEGNRVRGRNWAGLPIPTNPWAGTDAPLIASIRERMDGSPLLPDGPPLTRREAARYRLHLADGVEEGYAAIYTQAEAEAIVVYAMRFASAEKAVVSRSDAPASNNPKIKIIRVAMGPIVAMVTGDGSRCFQAVGAHLKSLAQ